MLDAPLQLGDAILGQLFDTFEHLLENVIPNLHKYLSWDGATSDLGPILPVSVHAHIYWSFCVLLERETQFMLSLCIGTERSSVVPDADATLCS